MQVLWKYLRLQYCEIILRHTFFTCAYARLNQSRQITAHANFFNLFVHLFKFLIILLKDSPKNNANISTDVVNKLFEVDHLVADGSRPYCLPTIHGKNKDLKSITPDTVSYSYFFLVNHQKQKSVLYLETKHGKRAI